MCVFSTNVWLLFCVFPMHFLVSVSYTLCSDEENIILGFCLSCWPFCVKGFGGWNGARLVMIEWLFG